MRKKTLVLDAVLFLLAWGILSGVLQDAQMKYVIIGFCVYILFSIWDTKQLIDHHEIRLEERLMALESKIVPDEYEDIPKHF